MEYIEKIKKMLCRELEKFSMKTDLTVTDLEKIHKLSDTIKNLDKIKMLEEDGEGYSEARMGRGGSRYSYDDEMMYSERRGRGRNAQRDRTGRYSSDGDYAEDYRGGMYSYDDAKDHMMSKLGSMMEDADPNEREILKDCMRKLERI
jgi:dynactin complex subunit